MKLMEFVQNVVNEGFENEILVYYDIKTREIISKTYVGDEYNVNTDFMGKKDLGSFHTHKECNNFSEMDIIGFELEEEMSCYDFKSNIFFYLERSRIPKRYLDSPTKSIIRKINILVERFEIL